MYCKKIEREYEPYIYYDSMMGYWMGEYTEGMLDRFPIVLSMRPLTKSEAARMFNKWLSKKWKSKDR